MEELLEKAKNNYFNEIDNQETFEMFNKILKETDNSEAKFYIAEMYYFGMGTEKKLEKTFEYMKELAEANYEEAYFWTGYMYFQGEGTEINDKEAVKYLLKAVNVETANTLMAEYILGMIYLQGKEKGIDVEENKEYGLELIKKSAEKGYEDAINKLKELNID